VRIFVFFFGVLIGLKNIHANNLNIQVPIAIEVSPINIILGGLDCALFFPYFKKIHAGLEYSYIKSMREYSQKQQVEYGICFRFYPKLKLSNIDFFVSLGFGQSKEFLSLSKRVKKGAIDEMLLLTQEYTYKLSLAVGVVHRVYKFIYLTLSTGLSFYDMPLFGFSLKSLDYKEKSAYISTFFMLRLGVVKV
jgi:hypothetical protein